MAQNLQYFKRLNQITDKPTNSDIQAQCSSSKNNVTVTIPAMCIRWHQNQPSWPDSLTGLAVQSLGELVDCRGDLQPLVEDGPLALETHVTGPFRKAGEVPFGLDVLT